MQGYGIDEPGTADLSIASNAIGEKYKCLAFTLEMPFKDTEDRPDTEQVQSACISIPFRSLLLFTGGVLGLRRPFHSDGAMCSVVERAAPCPSKEGCLSTDRHRALVGRSVDALETMFTGRLTEAVGFAAGLVAGALHSFRRRHPAAHRRGAPQPALIVGGPQIAGHRRRAVGD